MVAPGESARSRKIAAVRAVARWGTRRFATLHSRAPAATTFSRDRVKDIQEPQLGRPRTDTGDRAQAKTGWRAILLVSSEGAFGSCENA